MKKNSLREAFSLIELMVVTLVLGILVAIAMFSYNKMITSSAISACTANLRQIDTAVMRWSVENDAVIGVVPDENVVYSYIRGPKPTCASDGVYTLEPWGNTPSVKCSRDAQGHKL